MHIRNKNFLVRFVALLLALTVINPVYANATNLDTDQTRASYYLDSYNAYVYIAGGGEVRVYFHVSGTGYMDELGALSIEIWESTDNTTWTWKKSFTHDSTSGMLSYNDDFHSGYVTYNGTTGKYYKAYVCIWGGKNGSGDTRYFWTSAKNS